VLTPDVLARIFRAAVTRWDDFEIAALNPQLAASGKLPSREIRLVVRSDPSGTSEIFTRALSSFEAGFRSAIGVSATPNWTSPDALACSSNYGVAACVLNTPFSIGYTVLAEAVALTVPFASLLTDTARDPVVASVPSIAAAVAELGIDFGNTGEPASRLTAFVHHARGPLAWPIVGLTYAVLRKETTPAGQSCESRRETVKFWEWFYTSEHLAIAAERQSFVILPAGTRGLVLSRMVADVQCDGAPAYTALAPATLRGGGPDVFDSMMRNFEAAYVTRLDIVTGLDTDVTMTFAPVHYTHAAVAALTNGSIDYAILPLGTPAATGALPAETYIEMPYAGNALVAMVSLCPSLPCPMENSTLVLDLEAVAALVNGSLTRWLDPRVVALNSWLGVEPYASFIGATRAIALMGESAASETNQVLLRLLRTSIPSVTLAAFETGGRARIEADAERVRAAVAGTPFSLGFTPMVAFSDAEMRSVASVLCIVSGAAIAPMWETVGVCADNWAEDWTFGLEDAASLPAGCYPLSYALAIVSPRTYTGDACTVGEVVLRFLSWLTEDEQTAAMRARNVKALVSVARLPIQKLLLQAECVGRGPLLYLHVDRILIGTALHVLAYSIAGGMMAWLIWFTVWSRVNKSHLLIKSGQIGFMRLVTAGLLLTLASGFATTRDHSDVDPDLSVPLGQPGRYPALDLTCQAEVWLYFLGISITYSALMAKLMRATKVLVNPTLRDVKVPAFHFFLLVGFVTTVTVLLLATWSAVAPPYYRLEVHLPGEDGLEKWYGGCELFPDGVIVFPLLLVIVQLVVMLNGAYFCYLARNLNPIYAESRSIANSISSFLITHVIAVTVGGMSYPFAQSGGSPMLFFATRWLAPLISCCTTIAILYVPRVALWYKLSRGRQVNFARGGTVAIVVPPRAHALQADARLSSALSADGRVGPADAESVQGSVNGSHANTTKGGSLGGKRSAREAKALAYAQELEASLTTIQAELLEARDDVTELREHNNNLRDELAAAQRLHEACHPFGSHRSN
jgi:ABC-type phosphate transport system substrate-binding protein